jgi:hypothetical protein
MRPTLGIGLDHNQVRWLPKQGEWPMRKPRSRDSKFGEQRLDTPKKFIRMSGASNGFHRHFSLDSHVESIVNGLHGRRNSPLMRGG